MSIVLFIPVIENPINNNIEYKIGLYGLITIEFICYILISKSNHSCKNCRTYNYQEQYYI